MSFTETTVVISGMSCGGCVNSLTRVLKAVPGIEPLNIEVGKARLKVDADAVTPAIIAAVVERAGFTVVSQE
ncbi:MAG: heavy metal-associated domain-containing protein [Acidobacteriota bacterium]|nr:heavy metal-associated domain-containing protein [Acidobacteriota bacterium]